MSDDWYKRDTGAWLQVEQHLNLAEIGALTLLADETHKRSSWFVDDDKRVAGHLGISQRKWQPIKKRLIDIGAISVEDGHVIIPAREGPALRKRWRKRKPKWWGCKTEDDRREA